MVKSLKTEHQFSFSVRYNQRRKESDSLSFFQNKDKFIKLNTHLRFLFESSFRMILDVARNFYRPQTKFGGQGNIFGSVCHSVHRGGGACLTRYHPPRSRHPPGTMYPPGLRAPQDYVPPGDYVPPQDYIPPRTMYPLGLRTPRDYVPPGPTYPPLVDGLCGGGKHPTGMHSCSNIGKTRRQCHI